MLRGTKSKRAPSVTALALSVAMGIAACRGVLNPRPDDPSASSLGSDQSPGPNLGAGGAVSSGTGGGGPIFGFGGTMGAPPVPPASDASSPADDGGRGEVIVRVDGSVDGGADANADAADARRH
jgi:hypothetical protein